MQQDQAFELPIGTVVSNSYEIEAPITQDERCDFYKANHAIAKRMVTVKILRRQFVADTSTILRVQFEAKQLSRLEHKAIPTVYDFGLHDSAPFLVMEFFDGISLENLVQKEGPLSLDCFKDVFKQVANAMQYVHESGIIHTDLKPDCIVIDRDSDGSAKIKITSFFFSRRAEAPSGLTVAGELTGSPYYMSPEKCQGMLADKRSDIYSLGATMYHALSGGPPFPGDTMVDTMSRHISEQPPQITDDKSSPLYAMQQMVIDKCLEKNPEQRFQSMNELEKAIAGKGPVHKPSATLRGTEKKKKGWWPF